jgi:hypothetical protein
MNYTIIKADKLKHKEYIFSVWDENYPGVLKNRFEWLYNNNPAGPASVWLLKYEKTKKYVGVAAIFPRIFAIDGKSFIGGIAGDLVVNTNHRTLGPALQIQKRIISGALREGYDFLYAFPNKSSEPVLKKVGYKKLGQKVRLVKVLKTRQHLSKLPFLKKMVYILCPLFDAILRMHIYKMMLFTKNDSMFEELKDFDNRFDHLWQKASKQFSFVGQRSSKYLRWKFLDNPGNKNRIFALIEQNKEDVKGYIVYRFIHNSIEIRDFLFLNEDSTFNKLMVGFLKHAMFLEAESVKITLLRNECVQNYFKKIGFIEREAENSIFLSVSNKELSEFPLFHKIDNWLLLQGDDDM